MRSHQTKLIEQPAHDNHRGPPIKPHQHELHDNKVIPASTTKIPIKHHSTPPQTQENNIRQSHQKKLSTKTRISPHPQAYKFKTSQIALAMNSMMLCCSTQNQENPHQIIQGNLT
ncbi:hypothetical protein Dimus_008848 [Dionaea muscipula]